MSETSRTCKYYSYSQGGGGGSNARLGGRELRLLCGIHCYRIETMMDSLGTPVYYSLKLGGGGGGLPPCGAPPDSYTYMGNNACCHAIMLELSAINSQSNTSRQNIATCIINVDKARHIILVYTSSLIARNMFET